MTSAFEVRVRRVLITIVVLAFGCGGVVLTSSVAGAAPFDAMCRNAPAPERPDRGVAGSMAPKVDLSRVPMERSPDPFSKKEDGSWKASIPDVYGWAWHWENYDLGCGNDLLRAPNAVSDTQVGNLFLSWASFNAAVGAQLEQAATATGGGFGWLTELVETMAAAIRPELLSVWLPFVVAIAGGAVLWAARSASYAETVRRAGAAGIAILVAGVSLAMPGFLIKGLNGVITTADQALNGAIGGGESTANQVARGALYQAWLLGQFGAADSQAAKEHGPKMLSGTTYTWSEIRQISNPEPGQTPIDVKRQIDKEKADTYEDAAKEIKESDEAAYENVTGRSGERANAGLVALLWVGTMNVFSIISSLTVVLARLIMIALPIIAGVMALGGALKIEILMKLWDLFAAAAINVAKFSLASALMNVFLGGVVVASSIGYAGKLMILIAATVIGLGVTHPIRSWAAMFGQDVRGGVLLRMGQRLVAAVTAARIVDGDDDDARSPATTATKKDEARDHEQSAEESAPPLSDTEPARDDDPVRGEPRALSAVLTADSHGRADVGSAQRSSAVDTDGSATMGGDATSRKDAREDARAGDGRAAVVYPSGVVVAGDSSFYRREDRSASAATFEYVRLPEPEMDLDGSLINDEPGYRSTRSAPEPDKGAPQQPSPRAVERV